LDDQTILATIENFGSVTVCPGGVVHVHLPHCSLKFAPGDFSKFCELIGKARLAFEAPRKGSAKPRLQLVSPDTEESSSPEKPE
jgi:hypothetical protein